MQESAADSACSASAVLHPLHHTKTNYKRVGFYLPLWLGTALYSSVEHALLEVVGLSDKCLRHVARNGHVHILVQYFISFFVTAAISR